MSDSEASLVYEGRHLSMVNRRGWEYATRKTSRPAVGIVAITDAGKVVLVEQYRPPVGRNVVELPAGLSGDIAGQEDEALIEAAKRELLEETGYSAKRWTELLDGYSSPGLTDESITLFLAEGLRQTGPGGGGRGEDITVHEVPLGDVLAWLNERGAAADLKLLAGLFAATDTMSRRERDA
ncbi:MAG: NUDIX hydrolase [Planctomycetota bacterium]|nr:MAG: NUDIX hydrolase [Planctomycetota bacterium]